MKIKSVSTRLFPVAVYTLFSLALISCSNLFESKILENPGESNTAYICVSAAEPIASNRTIFPTADANKLTNLVLKGTKQGDSEIELASADTLETLSSQRIEIEAGNWDFTLTATLNGVAFSGATTAKPKAGKTINLRFQLEPDISIDKGGFSITVFFEGDVHSIFAEVYDQEQTYPIFTDPNITIETNSQNKKYIVFEKPISSGLDAGSYKVQIYLQDESHTSLNCYETSVHIVPGYLSEAVAYISISGEYSITFNFNGGGWEGEAPSTVPEVYNFFIKESTNLPEADWLYKAGYTFAGWYDNPEVTGDPITSIPAGTKGNVNLWAKWVEEVNTLPSNLIYVANETAGGGSSDTNDGSKEHPLDSIANAVAAINAKVSAGADSGEKWGIVLLSNLSGAQTVGTQADEDVSELVICSEDENSIKTIDGGFDENNLGTTLTISSQVKVTLQDIKITGGYNEYGGGINHQGGILVIRPGAAIYGNTAVYNGGGIFMNNYNTDKNSSITILGGTIGGEDEKGNKALNAEGGGIYVNGSSSHKAYLTFEYGSIKGNSSAQGGGVYIGNYTKFTMNGGTISDNTDLNDNYGKGGGVYIDYRGTFEFYAGLLSQNSAYDGGAIYIYDNDNTRFYMHGGNVSGNTARHLGPGVYHGNTSDNTFCLWKDALFGANDYIYMETGYDCSHITIYDDFTNDKPVATLQISEYKSGTQFIIDGVKPSMSDNDFESACSKIAVLPDAGGKKWCIKTEYDSGGNHYSVLSLDTKNADGVLNISFIKPNPLKTDSTLKFTANAPDGTAISASNMSVSIYNSYGFEIQPSYTNVDPPVTTYNYSVSASGNELSVILMGGSAFAPESEYTIKLFVQYDSSLYEKSFSFETAPIDPNVYINTGMTADEVQAAIENKITETLAAGTIKIKLIGEYNDDTLNLYQVVANNISTGSSSQKDLDFSECYGISVSEVPDSCFVQRGKNCTLTLSTDTTKIGDSAFHTCYSVSLLNMSSVTEIGKEAFYQNSQSYSNLDLTNVTKIGDNAFGYCYFGNIKVWTNPSADISSTAFKAASWDNTGHATRITGALDIGNSTVDLSIFWTCLAIPEFVVSETNTKYKAFSDGAMISKKNDDGSYSFYKAKFGSPHYLYVADFTGSGIVEIANQQFSGYPYLYRVNLAGVERLKTEAFFNAGQSRSYPDTEFKFTITNSLKFVESNALNVYTGGSNSATVKFVFEDGADSGWYSLTVSDSVTIGDNTYATADALGLAYYNGEITFDQIPAENKTVITTENLQSKMSDGSVIKVQE